jgi:hypothetical protein
VLNALTLNGPPAATLPASTLRVCLAAALADDATVSSIVGARVTYGMVPQGRDPSLAAIAYQVVSIGRPAAIDDVLTLQSARAQIAISCLDALQVVDGAEAVRRLLHGFTGTLAGSLIVKECRVEAERDLPETTGDGSDRRLHRTVLDVFVRYYEARP